MASEDYVLVEDVEDLSPADLIKYATAKAERIVRNTQGESWDDPEEYQLDSIELAHAFYRMVRDGMIKTPT